jgi:hypothetical protein
MNEVPNPTNLFEIRATLERNDNRMITTEEWRRVIHVPDGCNAAGYHAAMAAIHHCTSFSTKRTPKDGGTRLAITALSVYIFSASQVSRTGFVSGNTGTEAIWEWTANPIQDWQENGTLWLSNLVDHLASYSSYPISVIALEDKVM